MNLDRPLKFCMMTTFYPPFHYGGDAIQVYRLCQALARNGHEVHVIHCVDAYSLAGARTKTGFENHPNVIIHSLSSHFGLLSPLITQQTGHPGIKSAAIRRILQENRFDVVHYHNMSLIGPWAMTWGTAVKFYTLHEHWLVCPMHILWRYNREVCTRRTCLTCQVGGRKPPQLWRHTRLLKKCCDQVDRFIAPSQFTADEHRRQGLSLEATVIPHFIPALPALTPPPPDGASRPYFLYVGRIESFKGIGALVTAFRRHTLADLWIAGSGTLLPELEKAASDLKHVRLLGTVSSSELTRLYRHAIAVIVPSLCQETFGLAAVEALAHGTPAIVRKLGGLQEISTETPAAIAYESEDELLAVLKKLQDDPAGRAELGDRAREAFSRLWTEEKHLDAYFRLIRSCLASKEDITQTRKSFAAQPGKRDPVFPA